MYRYTLRKYNLRYFYFLYTYHLLYPISLLKIPTLWKEDILKVTTYIDRRCASDAGWVIFRDFYSAQLMCIDLNVWWDLTITCFAYSRLAIFMPNIKQMKWKDFNLRVICFILWNVSQFNLSRIGVISYIRNNWSNVHNIFYLILFFEYWIVLADKQSIGSIYTPWYPHLCYILELYTERK